MTSDQFAVILGWKLSTVRDVAARLEGRDLIISSNVRGAEVVREYHGHSWEFLTFVAYAGRRRGRVMVRVRCRCGEVCVKRLSSIKNGGSRSCGHCGLLPRGPRPADQSGYAHGLVVADGRAGVVRRSDGKPRRSWWIRCACGRRVQKILGPSCQVSRCGADCPVKPDADHALHLLRARDPARFVAMVKKVLTDRQAEVVQAVIGGAEGNAALARRWGVSKPTVHVIMKRAWMNLAVAMFGTDGVGVLRASSAAATSG